MGKTKDLRMKLKRCSKCKIEKTLSSFSPNKGNGTKLQLHSWCRKCQAIETTRRYYKKREENPQLLRDKASKWRKENREKARSYSRKYTQKRRLKILKHYSGEIPSCACCGEKEIKFLSIDHIEGGGLKHLRKEGLNRSGLTGWIIKNNFPKGFQILCHNCNFAKRHYGICPHNNL